MAAAYPEDTSPAEADPFQCLDGAVDWTGVEENREQQSQEIEVLGSIYTSELSVQQSAAEDAESRNSFQLEISAALPQKPVWAEVWVSAEKQSQCSVSEASTSCRPEAERPKFARSESGCRLYTSLPLNYLPPVTLSVIMPESYPSAAQPLFMLACTWLSDSQLEAVVNKLDHIWEEEGPGVIIYSWANWIKECIFEFLQIKSLVIMDGIHTFSTSRVTNSSLDAMERIMELITYDITEEEKWFAMDTQTCQICYNEDKGDTFFRLKPCLHHFCDTCISEYCNFHVQEGSIGQLSCPEPGCGQTVPPDVLRQVLGPARYLRWERLMVQRTLEQMGDVVWCPRCSNPVVKDESEESLACCVTCDYSFCTECDDHWHPGELCKGLRTAENRARLRQQMQRARGANRDRSLKEQIEDFRRELYDRHRQNLLNYEDEVKRNFKRCPHCKAPVEKTGGCNKMTCRCGQSFCWTCLAKIEGYSHFGQNGCLTFGGEAMRPPQFVQANLHDGFATYKAAKQIQGKNAPQRRCSRCRHGNFKLDRNNVIKCWFCKAHLCFMCGSNISGNVASHFANSKCLQHSQNS